MRQDFSSPTLSPIPPYPAHRERNDLAPPALPAPSRPLPPTPQAPQTESTDERASMRATHIRPRTAPASPERPSTAFSTRSTIRQVEPSPESLSDALANGFADGGTPAQRRSFEPFPPFDPGRDEKIAADGLRTHIPSPEPTGSIPETGLRRGGTPSGHASPRKSRSRSPQKSRSESPRKTVVHTPTLPAHQESPSSSSAYSVAENQHEDNLEPPDTPSPVTREQQRQAYAPLRIKRPFAAGEGAESAGAESARPESARAESTRTESTRTEGYGTHLRIADYMHKMKEQRSSRSVSPQKDAQKLQMPAAPLSVPGPPTMHIVQAMTQPQPHSQSQSQIPSPFTAAQKQAGTEPARHASDSRRSEKSGASVASKHSVFSTPGRDEMERKKPIVEEDEGPFAKATNMQDLEQRRRRVSETDKEGDQDGKKRVCGLRCVVM
ncbi:uncharacterized protein EKO05_0003240 [Ascochyta rabiei]|uniref:Uncharacterized protein n=1 Tax=Didymella rabiei TaxID=5454 RepID=A0A163I9W5_DIDRA|nr:uncharacterized protein EKO05_0003240 [Ascochyta rabiei]KZM25665.1 hypothetical protein ST47_g3185 [Ascochyta rabiei]UPX12701.1 hypothetical protein EKO05_0003240 [Ascochyta rabiei]